MTAIHSELAQPDDELVTEIIARRRRRTPKLTLALVVLVAAAGAFALGALAQKHWGSSSSAGGGANRASAFAAFASRAAAGGRATAGGGFRAFGGAAGGGFETGTVTLIKGSTLYITNATGNTVMVRTTPGSSVTKTVGGSVRSIVPGDTVTVVGTRASNGSYTARSIAIGRAANG